MSERDKSVEAHKKILDTICKHDGYMTPQEVAQETNLDVRTVKHHLRTAQIYNAVEILSSKRDDMALVRSKVCPAEFKKSK